MKEQGERDPVRDLTWNAYVLYIYHREIELYVVTHACNPGTWEAEAGGS